MNANLLSSLEQQSAELDALVRADVAHYTDEQLDQLIRCFLDHPYAVVAQALTAKPGRLCAMAAAMLQRERLRRAEIAAMENQI